MKYIIVPIKTEFEEVEAESAEEVLIEFANLMELDMCTYFMAIPDPNEYIGTER